MKLRITFLIIAILFITQFTFVNSYEMQSLALITGNTVTFCKDPNVLKAIKIGAMIIMIAKILVPVIIIVTGIKSVASAVIVEDDSAVKKAANTLMVKFFVGAFIFFVPTIINAIMSLANGYDKTKSQFTECGQCLTSIKTCDKLINTYTK